MSMSEQLRKKGDLRLSKGLTRPPEAPKRGQDRQVAPKAPKRGARILVSWRFGSGSHGLMYVDECAWCVKHMQVGNFAEYPSQATYPSSNAPEVAPIEVDCNVCSRFD